MLIMRRWVTLRRDALMANWTRARGQRLRGSQDPTMTIIKVRTVRALSAYRLMVEFSDDTIGEREFSFITRESGPMIEPLKDPEYFRRVFVENGVMTWPNGYDWDPIALHDDMKEAGELRPVGDAAE
jgi:uncharacterized protein DUF2442